MGEELGEAGQRGKTRRGARKDTWVCRERGRTSGTKKENKPKLSSPDIFRWGRGLPREGMGAKKFDMSFETRENNFFLLGGISRDFAGIFESARKI